MGKGKNKGMSQRPKGKMSPEQDQYVEWMQKNAVPREGKNDDPNQGNNGGKEQWVETELAQNQDSQNYQRGPGKQSSHWPEANTPRSKGTEKGQREYAEVAQNGKDENTP